MPPRKLLTSVLCLALGLGALSACGGDDGDGASASTSGAAGTTAVGPDDATATSGGSSGSTDSGASERDCRLTTEQVSAAAGVEMEPMGGEGCAWQAPGLETSLFEVYFSGTDPSHYEGTEEEVPGVGDGAKWDFTSTLIVKYQDTYFTIQVLNMGGAAPADPKAVAIELAQLVIDSY